MLLVLLLANLSVPRSRESKIIYCCQKLHDFKTGAAKKQTLQKRELKYKQHLSVISSLSRSQSKEFVYS